VSEYDKRVGASEPGAALPWRRQAGSLGVVFAVAAAVLAAGLVWAPRVSAYTGLGPEVLTGLVALVLLLAGACALFAVAFARDTPPGGRSAPPAGTPSPPAPFPDGSFPAGPAPTGAAPTGAVPGGRGSERGGTGLAMVGALLGTLGLGLATVAVALAVLVPAPTESIVVQFTDLYGRVQLEYCPALPASFDGIASRDDLIGSSTILPVKVTAEICGNPDYSDGVWIYLNRDAITIADRP
jgi:hypothetical protein